jgi:anti-sigma regulatory factor (Ser/Thr protein kinase)
MSSAAFEVVLRGGVDAAWEARHAFAEHHPPLPQSVQDDVALLVTELVTNAVRHGGAEDGRPLLVDFRSRGGRIRVEVLDLGTDFDLPARRGEVSPSGGWGLFLVDKIADRWGVSRAPAGTCVWFELPVAAAG